MNLRLLGLLVLYASLGILEDFLVARHYIAISKRNPLGASLLDGAIGILQIVVIATVIINRAWILSGGYIAGEMIGCFIGVKYGKDKSSL